MVVVDGTVVVAACGGTLLIGVVLVLLTCGIVGTVVVVVVIGACGNDAVVLTIDTGVACSAVCCGLGGVGD